MHLSPPIITLAAADEPGAFSFFQTATGPEFLLSYAIWFAALMVISLLNRKDGRRNPSVALVCCLLFEIVGVSFPQKLTYLKVGPF